MTRLIRKAFPGFSGESFLLRARVYFCNKIAENGDQNELMGTLNSGSWPFNGRICGFGM